MVAFLVLPVMTQTTVLVMGATVALEYQGKTSHVQLQAYGMLVF